MPLWEGYPGLEREQRSKGVLLFPPHVWTSVELGDWVSVSTGGSKFSYPLHLFLDYEEKRVTGRQKAPLRGFRNSLSVKPSPQPHHFSWEILGWELVMEGSGRMKFFRPFFLLSQEPVVWVNQEQLFSLNCCWEMVQRMGKSVVPPWDLRGRVGEKKETMRHKL